MSTRGWYEYYVMDPSSGRRTLAMQFYKWGDAVPENALAEYEQLQDKIEEADGCLPVIWLDDLLREQLGPLYENLPDHFSIAAFLFLIQRAYEETSPWHSYSDRDLDLPREERADYRLGFEVGKAMVLNGFEPQRHSDPILDRVLFFIAVGHFVRPWKRYGSTWSVLQWLQYLTQVTLETDMGSIAGNRGLAPWDISYIYRFFIRIDPEQPFRIERLAIELCDRYGEDLFTSLESEDEDEESREYALAESAELRQTIERSDIDLYSLHQSGIDFRPNEDRFWDTQAYEQPPLIHSKSKP